MNGFTAAPRRYVHIRDWTRFRHYRDREPPWIKNDTGLLRDDAYLALTGPQRALLHGLWLLYARRQGRVPASTLVLSQELGLRVTKRMLAALHRGGFIEFALAPGYQDACRGRDAA